MFVLSSLRYLSVRKIKINNLQVQLDFWPTTESTSSK